MMKCRQARSDIALFVGNDLQEPSARELEQHVTKCPECADHLARLRQTIQVFDQIDAGLDAAPHKSLWPGIERQVRHMRLAAQQGRFNGWVPAMAIAAACLMIAYVSDVSLPYSRPIVRPSETPVNASHVDANDLYSGERQRFSFGPDELPAIGDDASREKSESQSEP